MKQLQQGDVLIQTVKIPTGAKRLTTLTVAEGELTGHAHKLVAEKPATAVIFEERGDLYVKVGGGSVSLVHEEHKPLVLEVGEYKIARVLEYDYDTEEARRVAD